MMTLAMGNRMPTLMAAAPPGISLMGNGLGASFWKNWWLVGLVGGVGLGVLYAKHHKKGRRGFGLGRHFRRHFR